MGRNGEDQACRYLESKGHRILERNYRAGHKEIDIISLIGDVLVFTEIKARSHYGFGYPEEAVGLRKQRLLRDAAEQYCFLHPAYEKIRFDVLSLLLQNGQVAELLHFEDAFY